MASIEMRGLTKAYAGGVVAVNSLDLTIADGEFFALLGPSGCGKTTLLRTIAGLEQATEGSLLLNGRDVTTAPPGKRDVAMVFQDYALFPHMNVNENIAYPLRIQKVPSAERRAKAEETGAGLGLSELMERRPGQLSGGQQQRVALARAIAYRPQVFLFDEPLSNLDARLRLEARTFLKRLQKDLGVTTVFVTHDQAEALAMADRMAVMESGHIRQIGTPSEVFHRPVNVFVANFIGSTPMNLIPARVGPAGESLVVASTSLPVPTSAVGQLAEDEDVLLGSRPEYTDVSCSEGPGALRGTVAVLENLGATALVSVETGDLSVQAVVPEGEEPAIGAEAWVMPQRQRALVYRVTDGLLVSRAPDESAGAGAAPDAGSATEVASA
ncbi:MAG: multiple sugar transport system ATP-binding protein [Actinomycetota bacterium]|jgi:multiple sugar transport system ATP-binding protein|nr:multiple sugar transport system ATP-binding protein [Actinomycetota bacterium]